MGQISNTRSVKIRGIMRSAPFVRGFNEVRQGLPMDYDAYTDNYLTNERWAYERGRLFGIMYNQPLKYGRTLSDIAVWTFNDAVYERLIT